MIIRGLFGLLLISLAAPSALAQFGNRQRDQFGKQSNIPGMPNIPGPKDPFENIPGFRRQRDPFDNIPRLHQKRDPFGQQQNLLSYPNRMPETLRSVVDA